MKTSLWLNHKLPKFPRIAKPGKFDVVVVGGGITGITAAYLLKQVGCKVALVERKRFATVDTGHTTAHLTQVTDERLPQLVKNFGADHARAVWDAGRAAIDEIEQIVAVEGIDCDFRRVPGFLHAALHGKKDERKSLRDDAAQAKKLGFEATFVEQVPYFPRPGVRFPNQAKFHPRKYLAGLLATLPGKGCEVYEETEVTEFQDQPLAVRAGGYRLECDFIVIATHVPLMGNTGEASAALFQSKLAPYSSYVVGAKLPKGLIPEASFWDTDDPYYYLRVDAGHREDYAIFGGEDHKTGQAAHEDEQFAALEKTLLEFVPEARLDRRWSGQVIETNDGLPYIGLTAARQFVATGFAGNGMTFGTLAAMMARNAALHQKNPWQDLFSPNRKKLRGGTWNYLTENLDYPYYMLKDRLTVAEGTSLADVEPGEGKILKIEGEKVAAYRDEDGTLTTVSATCTHMGCLVHWNSAETTWDCPCHGSRFHADGSCLAGPAETPLAPVSAKQSQSKATKAFGPKKKPAAKKASKPAITKKVTKKTSTLPAAKSQPTKAFVTPAAPLKGHVKKNRR